MVSSQLGEVGGKNRISQFGSFIPISAGCTLRTHISVSKPLNEKNKKKYANCSTHVTVRVDVKINLKLKKEIRLTTPVSSICATPTK